MKVITFSRFFPATHPKAGQPTFFVEKIWAHLVLSEQFDAETCEAYLCAHWCNGMFDMNKVAEFHDTETPKIHTIRQGNRWKKDDQFSPRVWSGKPYNSKQITFAPPLTVKEIEWFDKRHGYFWLNDKECRGTERIANNDGLSLEDFKSWFSKPKFEGQIIHF